MKFVMKLQKSDPFYNPERYADASFVARKVELDKQGKKKYKYVYGKEPKGWDEIPSGKDSFEIGNTKTGSTIHISAISTESNVKVIGTLRNKGGEVIARINKEVNTGSNYFDEYRKWNPNKMRLVKLVVKELQLHDRPVRTIRDIERSIQDSGMFPEEIQRVTRMSRLGKSIAGVDFLKEVVDLLKYGRVTDRTRRQLTRRAQDVFDSLSSEERVKVLPQLFEITKFNYA